MHQQNWHLVSEGTEIHISWTRVESSSLVASSSVVVVIDSLIDSQTTKYTQSVEKDRPSSQEEIWYKKEEKTCLIFSEEETWIDDVCSLMMWCCYLVSLHGIEYVSDSFCLFAYHVSTDSVIHPSLECECDCIKRFRSNWFCSLRKKEHPIKSTREDRQRRKHIWL